MKKIITLSLISGLFFFLFPAPIQAVCPVCTIALGAGLGLSRWLGVDDIISGLWIGAAFLSFAFWLRNWLKSKYRPKVKTVYLTLASIIFSYGLIFIPLQLTGIIGHPFNTILGVDRLLFGTLVGSLLFLFTIWLDKKVRAIKGKQLFPYQKVIFPVTILAIASLVMYFLTKG